MEMIPVRSSAILAIGYDPATLQMKIKFKQRHTYTYYRVPENVFTAFLNAPSKGAYYDHHIRDRYSR